MRWLNAYIHPLKENSKALCKRTQSTLFANNSQYCLMLGAVDIFFPRGGGGTLGISGWGCAAGGLEPLTFTRATSAEFCYPILE